MERRIKTKKSEVKGEKIIENAILEVVTAVLLEARVFWEAMPCRLLNIYLRNVSIDQSKARSIPETRTFETPRVT
jgi:hypothetical protein